MINITGNKYGRLTVIRKSDRQLYWVCKCECGNEKEVRGDHLRNGKILSCGCLAKESSSRIGKMNASHVAGRNRIDITGQKFGKLTAVRLHKSGRWNRSEMWECKCECGADQIVCKSNLLSGHTTSCGCNRSLLEKKVAEILSENDISFTKNKTFNDCRFENGALAQFDFYVEQKYIIECDGLQHLRESGKRYSREVVDEIRRHDLFKEEWCRNNGIEIIRVPYKSMNKITIVDLIP